MEQASYFFIQLKNEIIEFSDSTAFSIIKFLIGIYILIVFVDIILLLFQRGLSGDFRETIFGMNIPKELVSKKKKLKERWFKIKNRLKSDNESEYKVAVIEADNLIDELVKGLGYQGNNLGERIDNIPDAEIEAKQDLVQAHEVRNRVIHDDTMVLDKKKAEETMENYENFLRYFMVIE